MEFEVFIKALLSHIKGNKLNLDSLTKLSVITARLIGLHTSDIHEVSLNGLDLLTEDVAAVMRDWNCDVLSFNGLTDISPAVTKQLAQWGGDTIKLNGLVSIDVSSLKQFLKWDGTRLEFQQLYSFSSSTLELFTKLTQEGIALGLPDFITEAIASQAMTYDDLAASIKEIRAKLRTVEHEVNANYSFTQMRFVQCLKNALTLIEEADIWLTSIDKDKYKGDK